jgi:hypothetical protein
MHKRFKERIEALEEARRQQTQPSFVILFRFVDRHGSPIEATFASARDFTCHRNRDETLADFEQRATAECLAAHPYGMPSVLFFTDEKPREEEPPKNAA